MEESEHDAGSLEQLELYADEHYLDGKLPLEDHLGKVPREVEECHQHNAGPLRFHVPQLEWTGLQRLWSPQTITSAVRAVRHATTLLELYRSPGRLHTGTRLSSVPKTNRDSSLNTTFCQSVAFHVALAWHHCRRRRRCSVHEQGAWIEDSLPQGVWRWFVEQLAPLHLIVSWNESLWDPRALAARFFDPLASSSS
ncbi:hypothetical protein AVEN_221669-1 [Araneus ventricosus]|uniref:Uncharacterized protein n=1 Tax=Araneus ventricosus TaxID=182803 RepID=A0A4Y2ITT7_ARAVE|nr:hypothetical protein AVEN_231503-1 [Araneus ventricosus]GBM80262.1 hypothetical protein AVEN_237120-1 [Araneus ventricosus]GBM80303.1 hypothetical protein AVEN_90499-1 [Araneus ventricosus]GBM80346.1 hypothetical protein AVEN_221669-1 [Araneus ventricosus]